VLILVREVMAEKKVSLSDEQQDQQPHAHVRYTLDNQRRTVPLSWFKDVPENLKDIDATKQYLVFYSQHETPESLLKKRSSIPTFESTDELDKFEGDDISGYYRASVIYADSK